MRNPYKILLLIIICATLLFSACDNTDILSSGAHDTTVCFLLGNTANMPQFKDEWIEKELLPIANTGEKYSVIVLDGNPVENYSEELIVPKKLLENDTQSKANISAAITKMRSTLASEAEIDILKGLEAARRTLSSSQKKRLIIFSSGLSTTGMIDFATNPDLINEDPSNIITKLGGPDSLLDLSNIEIVWYGLGDVLGEQESLKSSTKIKLKKIWTAIISAMNAEVTFEEDWPIFEPQYQYFEYPKVSLVDFSDEVFEPEQSENTSSDDSLNIEFTEKEIGFIRNTANFASKDDAISSLRECADIMLSTRQKYYIIGVTATAGSPESCRELSLERANAIKTILCEKYNIASDNLIVFPLGQNNLEGGWRTNDLDENGDLIDELAQKNRKVIILAASSKRGEEFIEQWEK